MSSGTYLSWEEAQRLALPPNTTMLIPPTPEPVDMTDVANQAPPTRPDWLDDSYFVPTPSVATDPSASASGPDDPDASRAAAERAEYGPGPVRLLAGLVTYNAILEKAVSPREKEDERKRKLPAEPPFEKK